MLFSGAWRLRAPFPWSRCSRCRSTIGTWWEWTTWSGRPRLTWRTATTAVTALCVGSPPNTTREYHHCACPPHHSPLLCFCRGYMSRDPWNILSNQEHDTLCGYIFHTMFCFMLGFFPIWFKFKWSGPRIMEDLRLKCKV